MSARHGRWIALAILLSLPIAATPARAAIAVGLTGPASVTPGTPFDVQIQVTASGSSFNAFDAIVEFDPAVLTPVPLSPLSQQEGTLMTAACGTRFHRFRTGSGRDTVALSLLCNGVTVTGPGQIYRLRFLASSTPQVTTIGFLTVPRFYNEGIQVTPVVAQNLTLGIGVTVDVAAAAGPEPALRIRAYPNPARGSARLSIRGPKAEAARVEISDLAGRVVREFDDILIGPGEGTLVWDGRSGAGVRQPAGLYFARLRALGRETRTTLVWLP